MKFLTGISSKKTNVSNISSDAEDAADRKLITEAMTNGEFINWDDAKASLDKKHRPNGIHNSNRKTGIKVSRQSTKKR